MTIVQRRWTIGGLIALALFVILCVAAWQGNWGGVQTRTRAAFAPLPASNAAAFAIAPTSAPTKDTFDADAVSHNGTLAILIDNGHYVPVSDYKLTTGSHTIVIRDGKYFVADFATQQLYELRIVENNTAGNPIPTTQPATNLTNGNPIVSSATYSGTIDQGQTIVLGQTYTRLPFHYVGGRFVETGSAKVITALDVQRLETESGDSFVRRIVGLRDNSGQQMTETLECPLGVLCTITQPDGSVKVFIGLGTQGKDALQLPEIAMTVRVVASFNNGDKVYTPCALARAEDAFGQGENPSFPAVSGNFACAPDGSSFVVFDHTDPNSGYSTNGIMVTSGANASADNATCPMFGNVQLQAIENGKACKLPQDKDRVATDAMGQVTDIVPDGFVVEYWTGSETLNATAGDEITSGEATFRRK